MVSFQPAREILSQNKQMNKQTKISNTQILLFSLVNSLAQDQENLCFTISPGFWVTVEIVPTDWEAIMKISVHGTPAKPTHHHDCLPMAKTKVPTLRQQRLPSLCQETPGYGGGVAYVSLEWHLHQAASKLWVLLPVGWMVELAHYLVCCCWVPFSVPDTLSEWGCWQELQSGFLIFIPRI